MEIKEGYIPFLNYKTYYRIANPNGKKAPLLILHGGPGSTHNGFELFDHMAIEDDRPIITYDQLGCGNSYIEEDNPSLWVKETWVKELMNLRYQLNLSDIHIMGQSWGGMLNIIYNCDYKPVGIKSMILSSTLSSASLWRKETHRLVNLMSSRDQKILLDAEKNKNYSSEEFKASYNTYYQTYIGGPFKEGIDPECLTRKKKVLEDSYIKSWGPCEFSPEGSLKDYEYTEKLKYISVPVLITSGVNDESTPYQNKMMYDSITSEKKWVLYLNSRHMSYYEEHNAFVKNLVDFLNEND